MRRKYVVSLVTADRAERSGRGKITKVKGPIFCEIVLCGVKLYRCNSYVMTSAWLKVCL